MAFPTLLIPRALAAVAHVNAVLQKHERGGGETEFGFLDVRVFGPGEGAFFKPLGQHPKAAAVPVEDLKQGAALFCEGEDGAAAGIFVELGGDCVIAERQGAAPATGSATSQQG